MSKQSEQQMHRQVKVRHGHFIHRPVHAMENFCKGKKLIFSHSFSTSSREFQLNFYELRGKSLASVRERVERQRSVSSSVNNGTESNSLEGLNLERGESHSKSQCVDQLDTRVSSLHKDVAALSVEVSLK